MKWAEELLVLSGWEVRGEMRKCASRSSAFVTLLFACSLVVLHWIFARTELRAGKGAAAFGATNVAQAVFTTAILQDLMENGSTECHRHRTWSTELFVMSKDGRQVVSEPLIRLPADTVVTMELVSVREDGSRRCAGGDFYEMDLASSGWHSRPATEDLGDGSYRLTLLVSSHFSQQLFNLSVFLLFDAFHGLDHQCQPWSVKRRTRSLQIAFSRSPGTPASTIQPCGNADFRVRAWHGRWTRQWLNASCQPNQHGRFSSCLPPEREACSDGWCQGNVSRLESNGWSYSAHCAFRIYQAQEAWDCLSGRWLLFWGDSNFQDTIRNLLLFVLDYPVPYWTTLAAWQIPRSSEDFFINPARPDQGIRISLIFNGHHQVEQAGLGLDSLLDAHYRDAIARHFQADTSPDVVIMNSGLHDGEHFATVHSFAEAAGRAARFWKGLWAGMGVERRPQMVYRTTIAPAGESRGMQSNPHKMEVFNKVMVERLQGEMPGVFKLVDAFDISFPWHYDNNYSDGGHYGRAPNVDKWPWFGQPHHYFVDVMLAHILVNAICQK